MPISSSNEIDVSLKEGTDIAGAEMPAGGSSGRGWMSATWKLIKDLIINNRLKTDSSLLAPLELNLTATALGDILPETDVSNYRFASIGINTTTTNQLFFKARNSQSSPWFTIPVEQRLSPTGSFLGLTPGTANVYCVPLAYKYFKIELATYAAGTTSNITVLLYQHPPERLTVGGRVVVDGGNINAGLPTASALSDVGNRLISTPTIGAANLLDNGTNLVRWRSPAVTSGEGLGRGKVTTGTDALNIGSATTQNVTGSSLFLGSAYSNITMQVFNASGSISAINCELQGSIGGSSWATLATLTDPANGAKVTVVDTPITHVRYKLNSVTGTAYNLQFLVCAVA